MTAEEIAQSVMQKINRGGRPLSGAAFRELLEMVIADCRGCLDALDEDEGAS